MLKSALLDFYIDEELSTAKQQLLKDFNDVCQGEQVKIGTHIPLRREGANRAQREVDDMFTMITSLDELLLLSKLPTYVTDNADKIPSTRLYEGDFSVIMNILEKMDGKLSNFGSALSAISRDVCALQSKSSSTEAKVGGVIPKKVTAGLELNIDRIGLNDWPALPSCSAGAPVMTSYGNPSALPSVDSAPKEVTNTNTVIASTSGVSVGMSKATDGYLSSLQEKQWSVLASTPVATDNRFAVLASTDDENRDDRPFVLPRQRSGRSAGKRSRQLSAAKGGQQTNRVPEGQRSQIQSSGRQKSRLVTGQSAAATLGLWAAKKAVKKAVFCVDNVGLACNEDDIRAHVSDMGVQVFTCFETKPRRRPNESADDVKDRKAFRLCTNASDRDRLLNPDVWPESIRVSDWFSLRDKKDQVINVEKRRRINESAQLAADEVSSQDPAGSVDNRRQASAAVNIGDDGVAEQESGVVVTAVDHDVCAASETMDTAGTEDEVEGDDDDDVDDNEDDDGDQTTIYHGERQ